ncbi:MAG: hypothetical protein FWE33_07500 [Defluviitaleaceae bacterium]|nr:hypothetical protein [Defluviitaleaceae bacterium]
MKRKHFIATVIIAVAIMLAGGAIIYADLINSIDNDVNLEVIVDDTEFGINAAPPSDNMNGGTRPPTTTPTPTTARPTVPERCPCPTGTPVSCWPGGSFWCSTLGVWTSSGCRC